MIRATIPKEEEDDGGRRSWLGVVLTILSFAVAGALVAVVFLLWIVGAI